MSLNALENFTNQFGSRVDNMGLMKYHPKGGLFSPSGIGVSGQAESFYDHVEMKDYPTVAGDFFIGFFALSELEQAQSGWSLSDGVEEFGWKNSMVVFADRNGDALTFDSADSSSPVYGSIQKRTFLIASSLFVFLEALTAGISVEDAEYGGDTRDDDMEYLPGFLARIEAVIKKIPGINAEGFMRFFFG